MKRRNRFEEKKIQKYILETGGSAGAVMLIVAGIIMGHLCLALPQIDQVTGNYPGWKLMALFIGFSNIVIAEVLFHGFRAATKEDLFAYGTVVLLGFSIFFFMIGLSFCVTMMRCILGITTMTVYGLIVTLAFSTQEFMRNSEWIIYCAALVMAVSNVVLIKKEGFRPANLYALGMAALMALGTWFGVFLCRSYYSFPLRNEILNVYSGMYSYGFCLLAATVICGIFAAKREIPLNMDYIVILGCSIRKDGSLPPITRGRVDRAIRYVKKQIANGEKPAIFVPSGGKGSDECLAEAEAMATYLKENGVDESRILIENQSTTTKENMIFSRKLIEEREKGAKVAFSTTSYHVLRAGILAHQLGWKINGMGESTKWYFWPNAFARELLGSIRYTAFTQCMLIAAIVVSTWLLTLAL